MAHPTKYTTEQKEAVLADRASDSDLTLKALSEKHGVKISTINSWVNPRTKKGTGAKKPRAVADPSFAKIFEHLAAIQKLLEAEAQSKAKARALHEQSKKATSGLDNWLENNFLEEV